MKPPRLPRANSVRGTSCRRFDAVLNVDDGHSLTANNASYDGYPIFSELHNPKRRCPKVFLLASIFLPFRRDCKGRSVFPSSGAAGNSENETRPIVFGHPIEPAPELNRQAA